MQQDCSVIDRRLLVPVEGPGHSYSMNGRPLAGVTTAIHMVLRAPELENWFKRVGPQADAIRDEAAAFGKSIHAGLAAHVGGNSLIPLERPGVWRETFAAGCRWLDENLEEVYAIEQPIASAKYGYAGKPDLYCRLKGHKRPAIIDYKTTSDIYWSHLAQLAAYRKAAVEMYQDKPAERIVLLFSKDEPGKVTPHVLKHHDRDFALFGYLLGAHNIMKGGIA
jgi:hypothetical protein